jgi:hypothetical protein
MPKYVIYQLTDIQSHMRKVLKSGKSTPSTADELHAVLQRALDHLENVREDMAKTREVTRLLDARDGYVSIIECSYN